MIVGGDGVGETGCELVVEVGRLYVSIPFLYVERRRPDDKTYIGSYR